MQLTVKREGMTQVMDVLRTQLPRSVNASVTAGALKKAAQPMVARMRSLYRSLNGSGSLAAATYAWRVRRVKTRGVVHIGPKRFNPQALRLYARTYGKLSSAGLRHGHLVERGTSSRKGHGVMPAYHIVERAAAATVPLVRQRFEAILKDDVAKAVARRARK